MLAQGTYWLVLASIARTGIVDSNLSRGSVCVLACVCNLNYELEYSRDPWHIKSDRNVA
jgi:hypothetical protein